MILKPSRKRKRPHDWTRARSSSLTLTAPCQNFRRQRHYLDRPTMCLLERFRGKIFQLAHTGRRYVENPRDLFCRGVLAIIDHWMLRGRCSLSAARLFTQSRLTCSCHASHIVAVSGAERDAFLYPPISIEASECGICGSVDRRWPSWEAEPACVRPILLHAYFGLGSHQVRALTQSLRDQALHCHTAIAVYQSARASSFFFRWYFAHW